MNQEYEVLFLEEKKTKTGKLMAVLTLLDPKGKEERNITLWGDAPGFADVRPGHKVMGVITSSYDKNNRLWKSFKPASSHIPTRTSLKSPADITAKSVSQAIDRREDSVRMAATFRDATMLTAQWMNNRIKAGLSCSTEEWQSEWKAIRNWLDSQYDLPFN